LCENGRHNANQEGRVDDVLAPNLYSNFTLVMFFATKRTEIRFVEQIVFYYQCRRWRPGDYYISKLHFSHTTELASMVKLRAGALLRVSVERLSRKAVFTRVAVLFVTFTGLSVKTIYGV